jgi:PadR family transcriptional regulator, regulatory protein AphA
VLGHEGRQVGRAIAHFWQFPHSQIYAETGRLARLGLLAEEREQTGRRRRSYRITAEGRDALAAWLAEPTEEPPQVRSLGLLKLFFGQHAGPGDVAGLARAQAELHRKHLAIITEIVERLQARGDRPGQLAVAELMGDAYRVMAEHWERIERTLAEPPGPVAAARGR